MGLGSWLKLIGGGVAAPFTGGASLPIALSGLSDVLGGAAKSGAAANQSKDALKVALEGAKLNRDKFATQAPGVRMNTSIRAALAKNAAPASVQWGGPGSGLRGEVPTFSGGANSIVPAMHDPGMSGLFDQIMKDQMMAQQQGGQSGGNTDNKMTVNPQDIGKTSLLDKIIGGGALGSSILSSILKNRGGGGGLNTDDPGA